MKNGRVHAVMLRPLRWVIPCMVAGACVLMPGLTAGWSGDGPGSTVGDAFVEAKPLPFSVDVWTDTGGQGDGVPGGTYSSLDAVTVYLQATWDCVAAVAVSLSTGELLAIIDQVELAAGVPVQLSTIPALQLENPPATLIVDVGAVSGNAMASDSVRFTVTGSTSGSSSATSGALTVDVFTDRGGRGQGVPGGTYSIGKTVLVTVKLNIPADVSLFVDGPSGSDSEDVHLGAGENTRQLLSAEEGDDGIWTVDVQAVAGGQTASDHLQFSVLPNDIWGGVAIGPTNAREVDALIALKMSLGQIDENSAFDIDRDGRITADDADLILLWAVSR